jgi:methyl-accepting chemotaxis protein
MNKNLRFSHKILLAAALIVIAAFASFTLYNDWLQRNAIRDDLGNYLNEMGEVTADNIQTWLNGRILLVENLRRTSPSTRNRQRRQPAGAESPDLDVHGHLPGRCHRSLHHPPGRKDAGRLRPARAPWYKGAESSGPDPDRTVHRRWPPASWSSPSPPCRKRTVRASAWSAAT